MDKMMKFSVGIGNNALEAEKNLKFAKERKNQGLDYNIVQSYDNHSHVTTASNPVVDGYLFLEQRLSDDKEGLEKLELLKVDPSTGLLNKVGYAIEVAKLKNAGLYTGRIIVFMDGDDLHTLNAQYGYGEVDKLIVASGQALKKVTRKDKESLDKKARNIDILNHRLNDSAGDEYLVDLACKPEYAEQVTKRFLDAMYQAQRENL